MVITREADYTVRLMLVLAARQADGAVSSRVLAEEARVPYELARGVLARLADAGLLESFRGRSGGYHLARDANEITIGEVLGVAGERLELNVCVGEPESCDSSAFCAMHPVWQAASQRLREYLAEITLAQVVRMKPAKGVGPAC